jgi:hypothetical protein
MNHAPRSLESKYLLVTNAALIRDDSTRRLLVIMLVGDSRRNQQPMEALMQGVLSCINHGCCTQSRHDPVSNALLTPTPRSTSSHVWVHNIKATAYC